ncbi:MAG: bifunctional diaminohydroxyphosphoribosylaminopyrimidine deaminase/5-amino-6-(5-phosphoribosylamino)uracil reductase RibD [Alteraurantiacibacter sp.]
MPRPDDARWMAAAAALAERARPLSRPHPGVGAILVKNGMVIGRGWTQSGGRPHAEAMALEMAGDKAKGATLYVTLEPCAHRSERGPACADLVVQAGLARVVVGMTDHDPRTAGAGFARLRIAGIEATDLGQDGTDLRMQGHAMAPAERRPHVTLKLAMSLDGCIAAADGESKWITGDIARAHVHRERARADAILVGGETLRADAPRLDVRLPGLQDRSPERVVLTRGHAPEGWRKLGAPEAIRNLGDIRYLFVEGGASAAAAFLRAALVDRLLIYRAPILIGGGRAGVVDIGLGSLAEAHGRWALRDIRQLGKDTLEIFERTR